MGLANSSSSRADSIMEKTVEILYFTPLYFNASGVILVELRKNFWIMEDGYFRYKTNTVDEKIQCL